MTKSSSADFKLNVDEIRNLKHLKVQAGNLSQKVTNLSASLPAKLKLSFEVRFCYSVDRGKFRFQFYRQIYRQR